MALTSAALRLCMVLALRGRTLAEDRVFDSAIATLDALVKGEPSPLIIVSADEADSEGVTPASLLSGVGQLKILVETAVGSAVDLSGKDAEDGATAYLVEPTDQVLEFMPTSSSGRSRGLETPARRRGATCGTGLR
jgi:hypothetical protein